MNIEAFSRALQESLGSHIPQILGAVLIFALGWLVAVAARAGTRRLLGALAVSGANTVSSASALTTEPQAPVTSTE